MSDENHHQYPPPDGAPAGFADNADQT